MLILRVGLAVISQQDNEAKVLHRGSIKIEHAHSGHEALDFMRLYDFDLVLMDAALPDQRGEDVVRQTRAAGMNIPIILLAANSTPAIRTRALDQGADDVVATPCDLDELLARVRAVVRRSAGHARSVLRAGNVTLSLEKREVFVADTRVPVSVREYGVLQLLFLRQNTVLAKTAFLHHLYTGAEEPELKAVDVIVCRVRKKLERYGVTDLIDTVRGAGYILRVPDDLPLVA